MALAVNRSAANLDKGSGTQVAKVLTVESLGHDKYDDLDNKLPKLKEHAGNIVAERDDMAIALRKIAETSEMDNLQPLEKFTALESYKANASAVVSKVESNTERQSDIIQKLCSAAKDIDLDLTVSALKGSNYGSELGKFSNKVKVVKSRIKDANNQFRSIFAIAEGAGGLDFSDDSYKSSTEKVVRSVRELNDKYTQSKNDLKSEGAKIARLQDTIKAKDGHVDELNENIKKKVLEIKRLRNIINGGKGGIAIISPWEDGSVESRRAVQGKIIKVDRKYGFVVVDLGTGTTVKQKIGNKTNYPNPMIPVNAKMIVARNIESKNGEFVGEIKLIKVHEDCSIANVISSVKGKGIAVGDTVFFSGAQIDAMSKK